MTERLAVVGGVDVLLLVGAVAVWLTSNAAASARSATDGIRSCRSISANEERLACYDREIVKLVKPDFEGRLSIVTDRFDVKGPTRLRFQSDGAIFVLYVKSGDDQVVQNLHIGGGGEDTYMIEKTGTYFLQINGSESWRIWLEPLEPGAAQEQ